MERFFIFIPIDVNTNVVLVPKFTNLFYVYVIVFNQPWNIKQNIQIELSQKKKKEKKRNFIKN